MDRVYLFIPFKGLLNVRVTLVQQAMKHADAALVNSVGPWIWTANVSRGHRAALMLDYEDVINLR